MDSFFLLNKCLASAIFQIILTINVRLLSVKCIQMKSLKEIKAFTSIVSHMFWAIKRHLTFIKNPQTKLFKC